MAMTEADVELLNEIDTQAAMLKHLVDKLEARSRTQGSIDGRSVATGRTYLQTGLMWLRRAVERTEHF